MNVVLVNEEVYSYFHLYLLATDCYSPKFYSLFYSTVHNRHINKVTYGTFKHRLFDD